MNLGMTEKISCLVNDVRDLVNNRIIPFEAEFFAEVAASSDRFSYSKRMTEILETLKSEARAKGLWNFWLTNSKKGFGLSTVEYAYLAEEMGKCRLGAEVFNCSAPDTGNMQVLERYGSAEHKKKWLEPLLSGEIRSAYCMTEPQVASSDATNMSLTALKQNGSYILNGEKWWASGAGDPRCMVYIVMVKTGDDNSKKHSRHSMVLVPSNAAGLTILRPMEVYGHDDAPHGHMHLSFNNVRIPTEDLLLGEGRGFEIAQGRLGPGRIHHCMRAIGQAEVALELMCRRGLSRTAFGKTLVNLGANFDIIAESRINIEMARLLCLKAAWMMDNEDERTASTWISKIKVVAPRVALKVVDEAIQMYGGQGISQDTPLAAAWTHLRTLRLADGPDAVHRRQVARSELKKYSNEQIK
ncbi:MAG: acyl-CoA dehydrogenase family protein [Paracoccaceae bacterium]|nr:acyl-CoA dehydrogenase family protein [Paracoccaceae bacterium]